MDVRSGLIVPLRGTMRKPYAFFKSSALPDAMRRRARKMQKFPRAFRGADRATYRARVKGRTRRAFHDFLPHSLFIVRVLAEEREPQNRSPTRITRSTSTATHH